MPPKSRPFAAVPPTTEAPLPHDAGCSSIERLCPAQPARQLTAHGLGGSLTRWAALGLMQYAYFHQLSHDLPALVPRIARFHGIHHLAPNRNPSISFSCQFRAQGAGHCSIQSHIRHNRA